MAAFLVKLGTRSIETDADAIEIGTRSTCTVLLRDPVASERHARIARRGSDFAVEDLGTVTGTWRNGTEVVGQQVLAAGDLVVVGCTRILVQLDRVKGTLQLEVQEQGFFFEPSKKHKGESGGLKVGGDAERWVRDEVLFGRFLPVSRANWIATGAALLLVVVLALAPGRKAVLQPGVLAAGHAQLFDPDELPSDASAFADDLRVAREQGCSACHGVLGGTPAEQCGSCHHARLLRENHPFYADRSDAPETRGIQLDENVCSSCHVDHQGRDPLAGTFVPAADTVAQSCSRCHDETPEILRRPAEIQAVAFELAYDSFPHSSHTDMRCDVCHSRVATEDGSNRERDFARVSFARCMACHSADDTSSAENAWSRDAALAALSERVKPEHRVRLQWHGSRAANGESRCLGCHAEVHEEALRTVKTLVPDDLLFTLKRRGHSDLFEAHSTVTDAQGRERTCAECHADEIPLQAGRELDGRFWHELHLTSVRPSDGSGAATALSAECARCHEELESSIHLAGGPGAPALYEGAPLASCAECHHEMVEEGGGIQRRPLLVAARPSEKRQERTRTDFPHPFHVGTPATSIGDHPLAAGCFACHSFQSGDDAFQATPDTIPSAGTCLPCHEDHEFVAGPSAACALCHPDDPSGLPDPIWFAEPITRMRSDTAGFSHWSRGHATATDTGECTQCHEGVETAQRVQDVPILSEADDRCFDCHLEERYHWRGAPAAVAGAR